MLCVIFYLLQSSAYICGVSLWSGGIETTARRSPRFLRRAPHARPGRRLSARSIRDDERGIGGVSAIYAPSNRVSLAPGAQDGELDSLCDIGAFAAHYHVDVPRDRALLP